MIRLLSPVTISERNMGIADRRTNERLFTHIEYMNDNEAIKYNVKINNGPVNGNVKSSTLDTATRNALDSFMAIVIIVAGSQFPLISENQRPFATAHDWLINARLFLVILPIRE